eukprot:2763426-Rhodomonas_salina.1
MACIVFLAARATHASGGGGERGTPGTRLRVALQRQKVRSVKRSRSAGRRASEYVTRTRRRSRTDSDSEADY